MPGINMRQLLLTICSLCCFALFSQSFYPPVLNYSIQDDGKERNPENYCVVQDNRGVIYVGNLFRPKDIVSGDFYWFLERDKKLVIICADCTGHRVPGAFMSMIGSDRLNNIVSENKITSPGAILSELNRAIKKSLKQDGQKNATRDGMDAAVCTIDLDKNKIYYAGANRPLWVVDENGFNEIKATKVAVAGFTSEDQAYEEHTIDLKTGLKFYMTSDGYADQFGGEKNKKFKIKNMKNLIVEMANEPFEDQKQKLEKELLAWMGDCEQVDDGCVIGFEVG